MSQLKQTVSLQLTVINSKRLSGDVGALRERSCSLNSARLTHRSSVLATSRHYKAIQKDSQFNEQVKQNQLNCMFLKRKKNLKEISLANQNIFLRIQAQKSQYELKKLKSDYRNSFKISQMISKYTGEQPISGTQTARPRTSTTRRPLTSLAQHVNIYELDRQLKDREDEIRDILQLK